ncbi:ABC transporter permease, partial [Candidatus Zixiibacteriota bacterium]
MNGPDRYRRLAHLTGRRQDVVGLPVDEDVNREIQTHLEQLAEDLISEGWEPEAARKEAHRRFGATEDHLSASRRSARRREWRLRLLSFLDAWRIESRHTVRALWKRPGFSLAAILIFGVGIGATVTIYTVFDTVLLRPLPYHEPQQLVQISGPYGFSPIEFSEWQDRTESYSSFAASWDWYAILQESDQPEQISPLLVTEDFLDMFDARLLMGRLFMSEDFLGETGVAVLAHGWWVSRWAADPGIIGRSIVINGEPAIVIGIVEPSFRPPEGIISSEVDMYLPLNIHDPAIQERGFSILHVMGRLAEGVSFTAAQSEANVIVEQLAEENPGERYRRSDGTLRRYGIMPLQIAAIRGVAPAIILLLGAVG